MIKDSLVVRGTSVKENVQKDLDIVNFQLNKVTARNNAEVLIFSWLGPDDIMVAVDKIDFKHKKQKFFDKPLYCKVLMALTPNKGSAEKKEDDKNEESPEKKEETKEKKLRKRST